MRRVLAAAATACLASAAAAQGQPLPDLRKLLPELPLPPEPLVLPEPPSPDIAAKVAEALGRPPDLELRKVRRLTPDGADEAMYCGQVLARSLLGRNREFQLFTYTRSAQNDRVRILGSNDLNGMRSGRKMIAWLKRAGCL